MENITEKIENTETKDAETFVKAILELAEAKNMTPLYTQLYKHFCDEMRKAVNGAICTPERMAKLYPIFREINIEAEENRKWHAEMERKAARRNKKGAAK
jgi:hypothetical protein